MRLDHVLRKLKLEARHPTHLSFAKLLETKATLSLFHFKSIKERSPRRSRQLEQTRKPVSTTLLCEQHHCHIFENSIRQASRKVLPAVNLTAEPQAGISLDR